MKFGLTQPQYEFILREVVIPLQQKGAKVFCFGSRARGDNKPFSDLDIMVVSDQDLSSIIGNITEQLIKSNFPYKVDLVEYRNYADSYKVNYEKEKVGFSLNKCN